MFDKNAYDKISFRGVALGLILFGAIVTAIGLATWFLSCLGYSEIISSPFSKAIGGTIILALGYLILELELLRKK
jgi:hypothetical protein